VKGNQPTLRAFLAGLPWADVPVADTTHDHGHGRDETRTLKAATVEHAEFPHARQAVRIQRWRREKGGKPSRETVYGITDLAFEQASAGFLADAARGQWIIENRQHHVRAVTFGEDASRSRTHRGPANLAIFRATVAHAVRAAGHRYVPAGRRAPGAGPARPPPPRSTCTVFPDDTDIQAVPSPRGRAGHNANVPEPCPV